MQLACGKCVYTNFGAIRTEHLGITPLTRSDSSQVSKSTYIWRWIYFDRVVIFISTTFVFLRAHNIPTCLAKVRESKPIHNERYNVDSPAFTAKMMLFFSFLPLIYSFSVRKKKHFRFYVQMKVKTISLACNSSGKHNNFCLIKLFAAKRPLQVKKTPYFEFSGKRLI